MMAVGNPEGSRLLAVEGCCRHLLPWSSLGEFGLVAEEGERAAVPLAEYSRDDLGQLQGWAGEEVQFGLEAADPARPDSHWQW